jgi:cytidylate kinase
MAIISISREAFCHGAEIAQMVAARLNYQCISREILVEAAGFFDIPEKKLLHSIHDAPSVLERITHGREKYIACIRAALLDHVKEDNLVYHGYAGHFLIPEIKNVLKVRLLSIEEDRIAALQKDQDISSGEAVAFLNNEDKQRSEWTRYLYGRDIHDPALYDLFINLAHLRPSDACQLICLAAQSDNFQTTAESQRFVTDLAVSSHLRAALQHICDPEITAHDGMVRIYVPGPKIRKTAFVDLDIQNRVEERMHDELGREILRIARSVPGVKEVVCDVDPPYYR